MPPPEWLVVHRELQALRAAASSTERPRRSKKKKKGGTPKERKSYTEKRFDKFEEVNKSR
jgi:hypothetical protein